LSEQQLDLALEPGQSFGIKGEFARQNQRDVAIPLRVASPQTAPVMPPGNERQDFGRVEKSTY
jgi:hypothetical protein